MANPLVHYIRNLYVGGQYLYTDNVQDTSSLLGSVYGPIVSDASIYDGPAMFFTWLPSGSQSKLYPVLQKGRPVHTKEFVPGSFYELQLSADDTTAELLTPFPLTVTDLKTNDGGDYTLEVAWGANKVLGLDSTGSQVASIYSYGPGVYSPTASGRPENAIKGYRSPWNYTTGIQNAFYQMAYTGGNPWIALDFSRGTTFNELVLYFQKNQFAYWVDGALSQFPGAMQFAVYTSNDLPFTGDPSTPGHQGFDPIWRKIAFVDMVSTFDWTLSRGKAVVRFPSALNYRYLAVVFYPKRTQGMEDTFITSVILTSLEAYNFQDMTSDLVHETSTGPKVTLTKSCDSTQTPIPTLSEAQITLDNETGRYNPGNSASDIYGYLQYDGRGDGIRQGVPVRLQAELTTSSGYWKGERVFDGFILNDDGSGGPQAVQTDTGSREALFICKGLAAMLATTLKTPLYEGVFYDQLIRDVFDRAGIPVQDVQVRAIKSAMAWLSLDSTSPLDVLKQMVVALPYLEINESHNPAGFNIVNRGRTRAELDFSGSTPGSANWGTGGSHTSDRGGSIATVLHFGAFHLIHMVRAMSAYWSPNSVGNTDYTQAAPYSTVRGCTGGNILSYLEEDGIQKAVAIHGSGWLQGANWMYLFNNKLCMLRVRSTVDAMSGSAWAGPVDFLTSTINDPTQPLSYTTVFSTNTGECPMGVVGYKNFVFFVTWNNNWPASPHTPNPSINTAINSRLYVMDLLHPSLWTAKVGNFYGDVIPYGYCPTAAICANDNYFMVSEDEFINGVEYPNTPGNQSFSASKVWKGGGSFRIWKHLGDPINNAATFVHKEYFPFVYTNPAGENYKGRTRYWLEGNTLYCVAQPLKTNGQHRYEVWSVNVDALYTGTTATLLAVLADNQAAGITDFFVDGGVAYILDRTTLYTWDTSKNISKMFDYGTVYNYAPDYTGDDRYSPAGTKLSYARFPHQICNTLNMLKGQQNTSCPWFAPAWSSNFLSADCGGSKSQAMDPEGKVWILLGPWANNVGEWSEVRVVALSPDQFTLNPTTTFDVTEDFVTGLDVSDGAPVANRISFNPNPYSLASQVSELWTQKDAFTFPAGVSSQVEIAMNGASTPGFGLDVNTRRYMVLNGTTLWDDPLSSVLISIEGTLRRVTFFALASTAFLTVDNTGKGACSISGATIHGKSVSQSYSNNPNLVITDEASRSLYKKYYDMDVTTPFSNDPKAVVDNLRFNSKSRLWVSSLRLGWCPILKPGDEIGMVDTTQGLKDVPFKGLSVTTTGFQTEVTATQLNQEDVL